MTHCRADQRARARDAQAHFEADARVVEATILPPTADRNRYWLDVLLDSSQCGFPTDLFDNLSFSLDTRGVQPQGDAWTARFRL